MKLSKNIATALLTGATLAAAGGVSAKPNDQLTVVDSAPDKVKNRRCFLERRRSTARP